MANLTLRALTNPGDFTKGEPLTFEEVDQNFINIDQQLGAIESRNINTENGITGGGNLSSDRTLSLTGIALAIHQIGTNGIIARTGADTAAARSIAVSGVGLTVTNADGSAGNPTVTSNATAAATPNTIVSRDASNNFAGNLDGTLVNARNFTIGNTTKSFNASANVSWSHIEIGRNPVVPITGAAYTYQASEAFSYMRHTATGAKTGTFNSAQGYSTGMEFVVTNRGGSGDLTLQGTGVTLNGAAVLTPGTTRTVKFISPTEADIF